MVFGWITERFVADFLPLLILSSMIGMIELWRWLLWRSRKVRVGVVACAMLLAMIGLWVNLGYSLTPDPTWTETQAANYLNVQRDLSNITGHPLDRTIVIGNTFPRPAALGTLFIRGNCEELYVALETLPKTPTPLSAIPLLAWKLVERAPRAPLCRSLLGDVRR